MVHSTMMMVITAQAFQNMYNSIHNSIYLLLIPNNNKANEFDKQNQQRQKNYQLQSHLDDYEKSPICHPQWLID